MSMTELEQREFWELRREVQELRREQQELRDHVAALEATGKRHKRAARPRPTDDAVVDERRAMWVEYHDLMWSRAKKVNKVSFANRHNLPLSEFYRCFTLPPKRGHARGSTMDLRFRAELAAAIAELKDCHGGDSVSQVFPLRPAV